MTQMLVTESTDLDRAVEAVAANATRWARLPIAEKIALLEAMRPLVRDAAPEWAAAAAEAKGIAGTPLAGEEWISGPWALLFYINTLARTLASVAKTGTAPIAPGSVHVRENGQVVVDVFPAVPVDRLILSGVTAQVWMEPGVDREHVAQTTATFYRERDPNGSVALVLGAGNIASIPPLDVLYKMYAEGRACVLKMNPINAYLGPFLQRALAPLVDPGFLRIVYGGSDVGEALVQHPSIDEIHVTGSGATHDAIVFGTGEEGARRKAAGTPRIAKPVTSELGNVSPTIVVPGKWSNADIRFQAEHIATQKRHNAGFNCISAQVLIVSDVWPQTPALLAELERVMHAPARPQYYPGAADRCAALGSVPGSIVTVDRARDEAAFSVEVFADLLTVVRLPGESAGAFLAAAVAFANDRLAGTLGANVIVDPRTERDLGPLFDRAISDLRYGCVAVNAWTGVGFLLAQGTWGAYPGHTLADVGSGIGIVHNALLFSRAQKTVVRAPFAPFPRSFGNGEMTLLPKPPWFVTHRRAAEAGRALVDFEASGSPLALPAVFAAALRD